MVCIMVCVGVYYFCYVRHVFVCIGMYPRGIGASIDMYWLVLVYIEKMVYIVHICTNLLYCSVNCTYFLFIACIGMYWYVSKVQVLICIG